MKIRNTALCLAVLGFCSSAYGDTLSISDGAASFVYRTDDAAGDLGNADWSLGGNDFSFDESWFLQTAGGTEELLAGTVTSLGADLASVVFTDAAGDLELTVDYGITMDILDGQMVMSFEATLVNLSGAAISGELVNYINYNLLTDADDDTGFLDEFIDSDLATAEDRAVFADREYFSADGAEIDDAAMLLDRIRTGTTLGRTDNGFTVGDFSAAGGWSFDLPADDFFFLEGFNLAGTAAVPEPSSFLALCFGSLCLMRRRRKALFA